MIKNILKCILVLLFSFSLNARIFYVAIDGNDSADGLTQATAWQTINFSTTQVTPGDTVYVKAGNYGNENVRMTIDGTEQMPITFEGYQFSPGDNPTINYTPGDPLDSTLMPLLDGNNRVSGGEGITLNIRQYNIVKNFQVQNYEIGVYAWHGSHLILDNIIAVQFGDFEAYYEGHGIYFGDEANFNIIKNSIVYNASAENIAAIGNNNIIDNCKSYSDDNRTESSSTDYYLHIEGNNNIVRNSYVERIGNLDHGGHGISFMGNSENNLAENNTSKNLAGGHVFRHRGVKNNTIRNCLSINDEFGLAIRDGASFNVFENCEVRNADFAINFSDTSQDGGAFFAGRFNTIKNSLIIDTQIAAISFHSWQLNSDVNDNKFENLTISNSPYLFNSERDNYSNTLTNSIVSGVDAYARGPYVVEFGFNYTNFFNNGFTMPIGEGNINVDPLFIASGDYHLRMGSLLIDSGDPNYIMDSDDIDMDGNFRIVNNIIDMGADEFVNEMIFNSGFE